MTYEEWADKYKPVPNHIAGPEVPFGHMFETFGAEHDHILGQKTFYTWTIVEVDGDWWLTPGYRRIDRIGYFLTEERWDKHNPPDDISLEDV